MLVSILILATIRATRQAVNQQSQLALFVVAFALLTSQGILGLSAHAQNPDAALGRSLFNKQPSDLDAAGDVDQPQLREGTLVPPTEGRMVMLGRRWAFVSSQPTEVPSDDYTAIDRRTSASAIGFRSKPRPTRLGGKSRSRRDTTISDAVVLIGTSDERDVAVSPKFRRVIVAENLMLQRIVEAIRADSSDDRWMVSGEVTEFFNENRLLIRTAQRATSK